MAMAMLPGMIEKPRARGSYFNEAFDGPAQRGRAIGSELPHGPRRY
jgi:hypothetical protein